MSRDVTRNIFIVQAVKKRRQGVPLDRRQAGLIRPYIFIQLVGGGFYIPEQD